MLTDKQPIYEESLEDVGRYNEQPALPFNAYGTIAMARQEFDNNSASSQFFFLLKESELTPAGSNLLDGRYSVFGYVVDGQEALANMKVRRLKIQQRSESVACRLAMSLNLPGLSTAVTTFKLLDPLHKPIL